MAKVIENAVRVGGYTFAKTFKRVVAGDGTGVGIWGCVFPAYTAVESWNFSYEMVSSAAPTVPEAHVRMYVVGAQIPISNIQDSDEDAADVTLNQLIGRYFRETSDSDPTDFDTNASAIAPQVDVGIPSTLAKFRDPTSKRYILFERRKTLGLPGNAVFTADNTIRYVDSTSFSVYPKRDKMFSITQPSLLFVMARTDESAFETEWSDTLFGAGNTTLDGLYAALLDGIDDEAMAQLHSGGTLGTTVTSYLASGFSDAGVVDEAEELDFYVRCTGQFGVYQEMETAQGRPPLISVLN